MKKSILFFFAVAAMIAGSCAQIDTPADQNEGIKLNITVADLGSDPATKAAKTGWTNGDIINCWFDDNEVTTHTSPDLILTYNDGVWTAGALREGVTLKTSGYFCVVYESYNDLSKYTIGADAGYMYFIPPRMGSNIDKYIEYQTAYGRPLIATNNRADINAITYSYSDNTLTATIANWSCCSRFKVLIKNDNGDMISDATNYVLQVKNETTNTYAGSLSGFSVKKGSDKPLIFGNTSGTNNGCTAGVQETDGIAFYYSSLAATNHNISFTLITASGKKSFSVSGKTIPTDVPCFGVSLKYSNFTDVTP